MAENTRAQAQLSFPELGDPDESRLRPAITQGEVLPLAPEPSEETAKPQRPAKPTRKRTAKPRIALVSNTPAQEDRSDCGNVTDDCAVVIGETNFAQPNIPESLAVPAIAEAGRGHIDGHDGNAPKRFPIKRMAHISTMVAAVVAVGIFLVGGWQFVETQQAQRESIALQNLALRQSHEFNQADINSKAVELLMRYNELMLQVSAPFPRGVKKETRYWKESLAISLLESLSNLTRGHPEWEQTILWAVERHLRYIREQRLACGAYSAEFIRVLERAIGNSAATFCRNPLAANSEG